MIPNEGEASIPIGRRKHLLKIDDENIHLLDEYNIYVQCRYKFFGREIKKVMAWKKGTSNEKRKLIPLMFEDLLDSEDDYWYAVYFSDINGIKLGLVYTKN